MLSEGVHEELWKATGPQREDAVRRKPRTVCELIFEQDQEGYGFSRLTGEKGTPDETARTEEAGISGS